MFFFFFTKSPFLLQSTPPVYYPRHQSSTPPADHYIKLSEKTYTREHDKTNPVANNSVSFKISQDEKPVNICKFITINYIIQNFIYLVEFKSKPGIDSLFIIESTSNSFMGFALQSSKCWWYSCYLCTIFYQHFSFHSTSHAQMHHSLCEQSVSFQWSIVT